MLDRVRRRLTYANVMATVAVFLALGAGAYAAFHLRKNSVRSKNIVNGQVKAVDLRPSEAFHVVGAAGEPGFQNGASSYGVPTRPPVGFYRDPLGVVHLRGAIDQGASNNGQHEFTLPPGYRPAALHDSIVLALGGFSGRVSVAASGDVTSTSSAGGITVLDGITFRCAPSGQNGCP